ncbi:vitelline envelope sperm lysin receptor-like [Liolophura sinensis]|uniref:vitelline envelope sperm lysin receptor-like n=1 Tax=Liolophura sinensis TaxID=3198878 RepID=UPI00315881FD
MARCRNADLPLTTTDKVNFILTGNFNQSYLGQACQFYKKDGSNTYTVEVEVGWGEPDTQIIQQRKIHTISCAYDAHGNAISSSETISDWFLNPWEAQTLLGGNSSATFVLEVIDVLDREVTSDYISIGRKVRLMAQDISGQAVSFRALSCSAQNDVSRYYVLRAGCGDGLVFPKTSGFQTVGNRVYSPYFDAFKLSGPDDTVEFQCRFIECPGPCNGVYMLELQTYIPEGPV